jgi:hypothetical protein
MKAFLSKYKWRIVYWTVFLAIVLYFVPRQSNFYLDNDIKAFKQTYLTRILLWTGSVASVAVFILVLVNAKSLKQSATAFISAAVTIAFLLFIFQDVFLGFALFLNRQFKLDTFQKSYAIGYLADTEQTKHNFVPYDIAAKQTTVDKKLIDKIYRQDLKQFDTVRLQFDKGLFGIAFQSRPFGDK